MLDTNMLLAGLGTHGLCEALLAVCFRDHTVVLSEHILAELAEHYESKFKARPEQIDAALGVLRFHADLVEPAGVEASAFEDADDLPVLGTAVAGRADCLVTGDKHLAALGVFQGIAILSPRTFYDRLRS